MLSTTYNYLWVSETPLPPHPPGPKTVAPVSAVKEDGDKNLMEFNVKKQLKCIKSGRAGWPPGLIPIQTENAEHWMEREGTLHKVGADAGLEHLLYWSS